MVVAMSKKKAHKLPAGNKERFLCCVAQGYRSCVSWIASSTGWKRQSLGAAARSEKETPVAPPREIVLASGKRIAGEDITKMSFSSATIVRRTRQTGEVGLQRLRSSVKSLNELLKDLIKEQPNFGIKLDT
jgi:hypothetical protein